MRAVIQRVKQASVVIAGKRTAAIGAGMVVLVGFGASDTPEIVPRMADKLLRLRLFNDAKGRLNQSIQDTRHELLLIPQVTLTATLQKGIRPSFDSAATASVGRNLFERLTKALSQGPCNIHTGEFSADMIVEIANDGPVTFVLDETMAQASKTSQESA